MRRLTTFSSAGLAVLLVIAAYSGWPLRVTALVLAATALAASLLAATVSVRAYLLCLGIQLPHSAGFAFRPAVSDLFLLPALVRTFLANPWNLWPRTRLRGPLMLMTAAFAVSILVGYQTIGRLTGYVLVNKTLGLAFLIAGAMLLTHMIRTRDDLLHAMHVFIAGVSVTNLCVLVAVPLSLTIWPNEIYISGSYRLFGSMLNPTAYGGIVTTAAMLELALLMNRTSRSRLAALRWINVWLMGLSVALTLSRSGWLSAGVAAGAMLTAQAVQLRPRIKARPLFWTTASVWTVLPALAMGAILYANRSVDLLKSPEARAAELQSYLVTACGQQNLPDCEDVKGTPQNIAAQKTRATEAAKAGAPQPAQSPASPQPAQPATPAPSPPPSPAPPPPIPTAVPVPDPSVTMRLDGPLMNARGFQDRFAIIGVAWRDFARSPRTMATGIGLGTFLETSEDDFGVRLIIHNTYAWFLMELGPLGFAAFLWLMVVTFRCIYRAWRRGGESRQIAIGLFGACAGMLIFFVFNEGFYQRHYWLLFVFAERLSALSPSAEYPLDA